MSLAELLKESRKKTGATQQEISDLLGVDRSTYSYYETGRLVPSFEALVKLAAYYNVSVSFFAGAPQKPENDVIFSEPDEPFRPADEDEELFQAYLTKQECRLIAQARARNVLQDPAVQELIRADAQAAESYLQVQADEDET